MSEFIPLQHILSQSYTFLFSAVNFLCPDSDPAGRLQGSLAVATCIFPLFHVWLYPWCNVSLLQLPWGYSGASDVGGIICNLLFCLFYLSLDGIPLLSKSNNYLNLDVKTLSIIIRAPFTLLSLMPVVTLQEQRPWVFFSSTGLSGSINTRVKSVPGDRKLVSDLRMYRRLMRIKFE